MAVIQRTECRGMSIRFLSLVLGLVLAGVQCNPPRGCEQARKDLEAAKLPASWAQDAPVGGEICGTNSCCSKQSEQDMFLESRRQLDTFLRESITRLSSHIDSRAKKFDALFREMMNTSKIEFHQMFQKTYGKIYLQNSDVFSDFFKELESYYKNGSTRLSDTLDNFFIVLYQRMFTVINSQYSFDEKYMECVSEHMKDVKPFGEVPHKFTTQLRRSFIATRTYHKSLSKAAEAAKELLAVGFDKECEKEMVQMRYCGSCGGLRGAGTCSNFCATVLHNCLRHHVAFTNDWDNFLDALDKVADRLVGPYNIEVVVEPLNIKISEAIMNFQESGTNVSSKIYTFCGKPSLNRRRRKANSKDEADDNDSTEIKYTPLKRMNGSKKKKNQNFDDDNHNSLERLVNEIKSRIRDTRQFWAHLPYQFCNNISAPPSENGNCWNGTAIGDHKDLPKPRPATSALVKEKIYDLQMFIEKLRKAYSGEEVEFIDDTEDTLEGSGSGSGDFEIDRSEEEESRSNLPPEEDGDFSVNEVPRAQPPPSTAKPDAPTTGGGASMSLNKALAQYLIPIVLVWFGGAISDLL